MTGRRDGEKWIYGGRDGDIAQQAMRGARDEGRERGDGEKDGTRG